MGKHKFYPRVNDTGNEQVFIHDEQIRVVILNSVIAQMTEDLIKDETKARLFLEMSKKEQETATNDFERGVLAAIALIKFRVHCICD